MKMFGVAENMTGLLQNSMSHRRTVLTARNEEPGEVNIRRGIFQGDSLSPMLFVLSITPLTHVLRKIKAGHELGDGIGTVNHLLFMDDLKL